MNSLTHRRAEARLQLLNTDDTPARNCPVRADQISHDPLPEARARGRARPAQSAVRSVPSLNRFIISLVRL